MQLPEHTRKLHVLVASADSARIGLVERVLPRLSAQTNISLRAIQDPHQWQHPEPLSSSSIYPNCTLDPLRPRRAFPDVLEAQQKAAELCEWADILCLAPVDAQTLANLLHGTTDTFLLEVVRGWDVSKKILLVPAMSTLMWENPMSKKQLSKLRRKWKWVKVMQPVLWSFEGGFRQVVHWHAVDELLGTVRNQVGFLSIEQDVSPPHPSSLSNSKSPLHAILPPEIWTLILDYTGDWELAQALHVHTSLPQPREWHRPTSLDQHQTLMKDLEWSFLTGSLADIKNILASRPTPQWLSHLCVKLTVKFSKLSLLSFLECSHKALFWEAFGHKRLPTLASATFGRVDVLEWWRTSPSFLTKEYTSESLDGASKAGFIQVLDWWRRSGLPLRYTESALEQASAKGDIEVLEWWKKASECKTSDFAESQESEPYLQCLTQSEESSTLRLKTGKSIMFAAQNNQISTLRWWDASGIPYAHEDQVSKIASASGHVQVLQLWRDLKGKKMMFDNQVLVAATKHGHANVLEWWKCSGLRVEYKTCDVEEALEDSLGGKSEESVRKWWAKNGLNLGISTSEWTKTKLLG